LEKIELKAKLRNAVGNGPARALRREGSIPAVLYGQNTESVMLSVSTKALEQVLKSANIGQLLLNLTIEGEKSTAKTAMIRELQTHPVSGNLIHADFYEIAMDRKINVSVPIVTTGTSKGVEMGGMLQLVRRELELMCLPGEIPESIEIDITDLDIGDSLHVEEIELGDNVEVALDTNFTVITVLAPAMEEEEEEEAEEGEAEEEAAAEGEETAEPASEE
jgi:large subunit ribosomal protein L25